MAKKVDIFTNAYILTLFYTRGLGIVVLHVMVPEPYSFLWIPIRNCLYQKIHICIYLKAKTIERPTPSYSI